MRPALSLAMLLAAAALLSGCAAFGPDLTSAVPPGLTATDAAAITAAMTDLATRRLPAEAGAIRVDAPAGDAVLTPALTSDLRSAGYTVAGDGPHRLAYQVSLLDADVLLRMDLDGARATRLFVRTPGGLQAAGAFTVREAAAR